MPGTLSLFSARFLSSLVPHTYLPHTSFPPAITITIKSHTAAYSPNHQWQLGRRLRNNTGRVFPAKSYTLVLTPLGSTLVCEVWTLEQGGRWPERVLEEGGLC